MSGIKTIQKLNQESAGLTLTVKLGSSTKEGLKDFAAYCGKREEDVLRHFAILPAALYNDIKSESIDDPTGQIRAECASLSIDSQFGYVSYYWLKGKNSEKCEKDMKRFFNEPPKYPVKLRVGENTMEGLQKLAAYCELDLKNFLVRYYAVLARTLLDVKAQGEYDSSADLKAIIVYVSGDNLILKDSVFNFRPGIQPQI